MVVFARVQLFIQRIKGQYYIIELDFSGSDLVNALQGELPDYLQDAIEFRLLLYAAKEFEFYNPEVIVSYVWRESFSFTTWH